MSIRPDAGRPAVITRLKERLTMGCGTHLTSDHEFIRNWATERNGRPVTIQSATREALNQPEVRILFPDYNTDKYNINPLSWDEFFERFEQSNLALLYQERSWTGGESRFCILVDREMDFVLVD